MIRCIRYSDLQASFKERFRLLLSITIACDALGSLPSRLSGPRMHCRTEIDEVRLVLLVSVPERIVVPLSRAYVNGAKRSFYVL